MGNARMSWEYAERFTAEDEAVRSARLKAEQLGGAVPIGPGGGAALRFLARAVDAKAVIELGTGCGVSGTYLLQGMRSDGVLTSVDVEAEQQRVARGTFTAAGFAASRFRLIRGSALDVLPRFTEGAYDLLFVDAAKGEYPDYLAAGMRLLRVGGIAAFDNALWHDRVADPDVVDPDTLAIRALLDAARLDDTLVSVLLPVGDGLLAVVKSR